MADHEGTHESEEADWSEDWNDWSEDQWYIHEDWSWTEDQTNQSSHIDALSKGKAEGKGKGTKEGIERGWPLVPENLRKLYLDFHGKPPRVVV